MFWAWGKQWPYIENCWFMQTLLKIGKVFLSLIENESDFNNFLIYKAKMKTPLIKVLKEIVRKFKDFSSQNPHVAPFIIRLHQQGE